MRGMLAKPLLAVKGLLPPEVLEARDKPALQELSGRRGSRREIS
jgi:hypothetical protein